MLLEHMFRDILIDAYRSEAAMPGHSWLPCRQTVANHGRTRLVAALAGGAQA